MAWELREMLGLPRVARTKIANKITWHQTTNRSIGLLLEPSR